MFYISNLQPVLPPYVLRQESCVTWLAQAYEITQGKPREQLAKILQKFMAKPEQIRMRRHFLPDFSHENWEEMIVFFLRRDVRGADIRARNIYHQEKVLQVFDDLYQGEDVAPSTMMHVTCTGYASPSAPYHVISKKGWQTTNVTQVYHMGCFASVPALRLATQDGSVGRVDIVHTELCSLHFDPTNFSAEQMVIHGLFADGAVKYSVGREQDLHPASVQFRVDNIVEKIIPDTQHDMTWNLSSHGFQMTLSRDVPDHIVRNVFEFLARLTRNSDTGSMIFAIHPGGPKIIDSLVEALELKPWQVKHSRDVLENHGNMSSATLPHIWEKISADPSVQPGTQVLSMAFGPGLTLCGALLTKVDRYGA